MKALYVIGENPMRSEADQVRTRKLLEGLDCLVVQDISLTATAEVADVVLPAAAGWCESEGTVTSSERRVQRVRMAIPPPKARATTSTSCSISRGAWGTTGAAPIRRPSGTRCAASRRCTPA